MRPSATEPPLQSWKDIAGFLGVSVRTAQSWERDRGLPVHRMGGERARVSANVEELDKWRIRNETVVHPFEALRFWRIYAGILTLLLTLAAGHELAHYVRQRPGDPVQVLAEAGTLTALDAAGRVVWNRVLPGRPVLDPYAVERSYPRRRLWFGDADGDRQRETIFITVSDRQDPYELVCLSQHGAERWRIKLAVPDRSRQTDELQDFITDLSVTPTEDHSGAVFVGICSLPDHRGRVVGFDHDGKMVGVLPFPGHVEFVEMRGLRSPPRVVFVGGFDSTTRQAALLAANPRTLAVTLSCRFPQSCISRSFGEPNRVYRLGGSRNSLEVGVEEAFDHRPIEIVYRLDRDEQPRFTWFSDSFRALHKRLEVEGRLRHTIEADNIQSHWDMELPSCGR